MEQAVTAAQHSTASWLALRAAGEQQEQQRWERAVRRVALVVEPAWPQGYSAGPFSTATGVLAMVCFALLPDTEPGDVTDLDLLAVLDTTADQEWVGNRLTAALAACGQADGELGRCLARLRETEVSVAEWEAEGLPDPLSLPSELAPDFRERLAEIVEWAGSALWRGLAAAPGR